MAYDDRDEDLDIRKSRGSSAGGGGDVPNYLVQSILCVFCCWPLAIAAIVNAAKVNGLLASGDYEGAVKASEAAKKYCWIAFVIGIFVQGGGCLFQIMAGMGQQGGRGF